MKFLFFEAEIYFLIDNYVIVLKTKIINQTQFSVIHCIFS